MKKNKTNLEKLIKKRTKINPPGLQYFLDIIVPEYYARLKTISTIDYADRVFSEFIRLSNANEKGYCVCVTCGAVLYRTDIQNGHYKSRWSYKYRFDVRNCHPQCEHCNLRLSGNYRNYHIYMVNTYGEEVERSIREDNTTQKLYEYDLIMQCVDRHAFIKEKKQQIIDNQNIADSWRNPLNTNSQILI